MTKEKSLLDLLRQIKEVLDEHNVEFWLECGTLLGAVRNGKFISWEHDIDLGVWQDSASDSAKILISQELSHKGFKVYVAENCMTIKNIEEVWADINFYSLIDDKAVIPKLDPKNSIGKFLYLFSKVLLAPPYYYKIDFKRKPAKFAKNILIIISRILPTLLRNGMAKIMLSTYKKIGSKDVSWVVPNHYFSNLSTVTFYGIEFKVPDKTEEYVAFRYGEDWRTPKKNWLTARDDGAANNLSSKE